MFTGDLKAARQSLRTSRWRTNFTMLGIIIGITSVVTVVSLGEGLKHQIVGQINQLGNDVLTVRPGKLLSKDGKAGNLNIYAFLAPSTLTMRDLESIQHSEVISKATPIEFITNSASGDNGEFDNLFVAGTTPDFADTLHQKIAYGAFFSEDEDNSGTAIIGSDVAGRMFGILNPVGETIHIMGQDFTVHGVLAPTQGGLLSLAQADYNSSVFISTDDANKLTTGHTNILQILARVKPGVNINHADSTLNSIIARNHGGTHDFTVLKPDQLLGVTSQVLDTITRFVSAIAAISLIVGGIGIMNIMLVSVSERTREIGIRKAVGATNRQILRQFLTEGLVLTISGGIVGVIVSLILNLLLRLYSGWKPVVSIWVVLLAVGVSVAAGLIFSLIPALKAARKDPITALRGE
jgi:putative ABC transport system permease protein